MNLAAATLPQLPITWSTDSLASGISLRGDSDGGDLKFGSGKSMLSIVRRSNDPSIGNVEVVLVSLPSSRRSGVIAVTVPRGGIDYSQGFTFPLPQLVADSATAEIVAVAAMNGGPMPSWLQYIASSKSFMVTTDPFAILPMQVQVKIGNQPWIIRVTQRDR